MSVFDEIDRRALAAIKAKGWWTGYLPIAGGVEWIAARAKVRLAAPSVPKLWLLFSRRGGAAE